MTQTIIDRAIQKATKSSCRYKVVAVGFDKNKEIVGFATNYPRFNRENGSVHAEMSLMRRYGECLRTIWIFRVGWGGKPRKIEACANCQKIANKLGIKIISGMEL